MTTNTAGSTARELAFQAVHYLRRTLTFATADGNYSLGKIPSGSQILQTATYVKTIFNGSSATLSIGTNSTSFDNIEALTQDDLDAQQGYVETAASANLTFTQDTEVILKFAAGTTTAPTAGSVTVVLTYVPDNDQ
jgi:hypothetical protein